MVNINSILMQRLVDGYDYLNQALFDGKLISPVITIDPWTNKSAYYVPEKIWDRRQNRRLDLIAIGDDLVNVTDHKLLSCLAHEMAHQAVFQQHKQIGHGREWVKLMREMGLHPHFANHGYITDSHISSFEHSDNIDHTVQPGAFKDAATGLIDMGWTFQIELIKRV